MYHCKCVSDKYFELNLSYLDSPDMEYSGEEFVHGAPITDRSDYTTHQPTSMARADVDWQRTNGNKSVPPNDNLPTYEPVHVYGYVFL